ncbi:MAG: aldehyde dehydrogenase, partial [Planctomycetota bacterium]
MFKIANYIDGELVEPRSGGYLENVDPATGQVYSFIPDSDERDVDNAVAAAEAAFPLWSRTPTERRSRLLLKIADLIENNLEDLARAECVDTGKPLRLARTVDIPRAVANFRFFATAILHAQSESHATDHVALNYTLRRPRGVAGLISPWNLPLYLFTWKVAPALATGCTAVGKPSEVTPMTAHMLADLCRQAGLPPGVLNIVHGPGPTAGAAIVRHPKVPTISFTGGTATGAEIARSAGPMFKRTSLELGGKNPNIIFADTQLEEALTESVRSSFANQGQICLCGSRVFVETPIYDAFVEGFAKAAAGLRVADPLEETTDQGALVSKGHWEKVRSYVQLGQDEGGTIVCGGDVPSELNDRCREGFFFQPTVVTGLGINCRTNQEEIFGPVATITPFETEDQVIEYANNTQYGLSASVWTQDVSRAHRVAEQINCGTVWVNCWLLRDLRVPFGGMRQSGVGREGGQEALRFFTEPKNVCIKVP